MAIVDVISHTDRLSVGVDKENADIEEHMTGHRPRPHSRDDAGVGLPAGWNRRKRVKQEDADVEAPVESDKDMSLNYKHAAGRKLRQTDMARRIDKLDHRLAKAGPGFAKGFQQKKKEIRDQIDDDPGVAAYMLDDAEQSLSSSSSRYHGLFSSGRKDLSTAVADAWNTTKDFYGRAGIAEAARKSASAIGLPNYIKIPILNGSGDVISDYESIRSILEPEESIGFSDDDIDAFISLASAYRVIRNNPKSISAKDIKSDSVSSAIKGQVDSIRNLVDITSTWHDIVKEFSSPGKAVDISEGDWNAVINNIRSFVNRGGVNMDLNKTMTAMVEQLNERGGVPEDARPIFIGYGVRPDLVERGGLRGKKEPEKKEESESTGWEDTDDDKEKKPGDEPGRAKDQTLKSRTSHGASTSYGAVCRRMMNKLSAYHGIVYQGHPDPAGSALPKYDKRYFGKEHYDAILAAASEYLKSDWLKHGWGKDPGDAPIRAALDMAIHTADDGLYQSKIDASTYNMLLNRLAGWDFDVFNETVFSKPKTASSVEAGPETGKTTPMASTNQYVKPLREILRVADDLRTSHPELALQIVKSAHALSRSVMAAGLGPEHGEAFREQEEKELIKKIVLERTKGTLPDSEVEKFVNSIVQSFDRLERLEDEAKNKQSQQGLKQASDCPIDPNMLGYIITVAHDIPKYRKYSPLIVAAVKKMREKGKKEEKGKEKGKDGKKTQPDPSVPVKEDKGKKAPKKEEKAPKKEEKPSKKKAAAVVITASDINW